MYNEKWVAENSDQKDEIWQQYTLVAGSDMSYDMSYHVIYTDECEKKCWNGRRLFK